MDAAWRCRMRVAPGPQPVLAVVDVDDLLDDPVLGADDRGTERDEMRVGRAPVVHGDRVEPGRAVCDGLGSQLLHVAADRLLALVDAEHRLEPRRIGLRGAVLGLGVDRHGVERLGVEAPLVGQVEDAPALQVGERLDLLHELRPAGSVHSVEHVGREFEDLRDLEDEERTLLDARRPLAVAVPPDQPPEGAHRRGDAQGGPRGVGQSEAIQQETDGQEFDEAPRRHRPHHAVLAKLDLVDHAAPPREREQGGRQELLPLVLGHAEERQGLPRCNAKRRRSRPATAQARGSGPTSRGQ